MIGAELLAAAAAMVGGAGSGDEGVAALRAQWPNLRFVACSEDDIPARLAPAFEADGFNLYLVGGGEHCLALTRDLESAIGVVVARVAE